LFILHDERPDIPRFSVAGARAAVHTGLTAATHRPKGGRRMGARRPNVVLVVVDSLRACSLGGAPRTPFLDRLGAESVHFRRAYATECWTLPTHMSMFTGLLPSEHGAHFQSMAYAAPAPTLGEILAAAGYHTEVITRNSLFDGTVPGTTRGFARNTRVLAELGRWPNPLAVMLALAKPRLRRAMQKSGFFHALQRENRAFLTTLARMGIPADRLVLARALEVMSAHRRARRPYFLFLNLYDVHAPYSPAPDSPLRSFRSLAGWAENVMLPWVLPRVSTHAYLRPGFRMGERSRQMLLGRYHRAIDLMDAKLADFCASARASGLLDDTVLVVTSDHGEAFGEHRLYFHDASVYDTHLHVPLWIVHPDVAPRRVDEVVSTRALFQLLRAVALDEPLAGTLLDPEAPALSPVALAEHFHYPFTDGLLPCYVQNIAAAVVGTRKAIVRREGVAQYDLATDPVEMRAETTTIAEFAAACRRDGLPAPAVRAAVAHLGRWEATAAAA
jgi:arylsulfatase A-like enzyme